MNIPELLPVLSGLLLGSLVGLFRPFRRRRIEAFLIVTLGALATLASGEFRLSWAFLLIDIPLVALSFAAGLAVMPRLRLIFRKPADG